MKAGVTAAAAAVVALPVAVLGLVLGGAGASTPGPALGPAGAVGGLNLALMPAAGRKYASWYVKSAAQCPQLSPALLAAQGYQESRFDPDVASPAGAVGIAQFLPSTYVNYDGDGDSDGDGVTGPTDPEDAIMAQGRFMCSLVKRAETSGYQDTPVRLALAGYNAGWGRVQQYNGVPPESFAAGQTYHYVEIITATAKKWSKIMGGGISGLGTGSGPDAVRRAYIQLGVPYAYGGGTPSGPSTGACSGGNGYRSGRCVAATTTGFDCSSLTQYAWWPSMKLPRTAADQYSATASRPVSQSDLKPGDLLFWSKGGTDAIYHVALYYGYGKILHAPRTGRTVDIVDLSSAMPKGDYVGATRPGA